MSRPTKPMKLDHDGDYFGDDHDRPHDDDNNVNRGEDTGRRQSRISKRLSQIGDYVNRSTLRVSLSAMNTSPIKRNWLPPLIHLAYNPLTMAGLFLVNASAVLWLFVLPVATKEAARHPYLLIVFFGVLPIAFLIGLACIPGGMSLRFRRLARGGISAREFEPIGWDNIARRAT
jgi:hypothetical protein